MSWKIKSVKELFSSKMFRFRSEECLTEDGKTVPNYYIVSPGDWVQIIPMVSASQLVVVEQYRHAGGEIYTEFPGGVIDPGEVPEQAAERELLEECGFSSENIEYLGCQRPNPAFLDNKIHIFVAKNCKKVSEQNLDEFEDINFKVVNFKDLADIVSRDGNHSLFLSTYLRLQIYLKKNS